MGKNGKYGYVYLICDPEEKGKFKIGVTRGSIEKRIKSLQTGNPNEIFICKYFKTVDPYFFEKQLHFRYRDYKAKGEWFELGSDEIEKFETYCKQISEMYESLKDNPFFKKKLKTN